jgi:hypothetical protein
MSKKNNGICDGLSSVFHHIANNGCVVALVGICRNIKP